MAGDITSRYRLELDSVSLMGQLAAVEATAGSQISQMVRPIESSILQTFQSGATALATAHSTSLRAQLSLPGAGGFFAQDLTAAGKPQGFVESAMKASGFLPSRNYEYTPGESRYLQSQNFVRQFEGAALNTARSGMELAGAFGGGAAGYKAGAAIGRGLFGEAGASIGGAGGAYLGARLGDQAYGPVGGATLGGALGSSILGNIPLISSIPGVGKALSTIGGIGGGLLGGAAGTLAQGVMETIGQRNAIRPLVEAIGATTGARNNPLGAGFAPEEVNQITRGVSKMAAQDYRYDMGDMAKIMQSGAEQGKYRDMGNVQSFMSTTRQLIDDTKTIQTSLRKSIDDSLEVMQQLTRAHGTRANVPQLVSQIRGAAMATGFTPDQLMQMGVGTTMTPGAASHMLSTVVNTARETGFTREQLLEAGVGTSTMGMGAVQLLGGLPGIAKESGIPQTRLMEAGMASMGLTKGFFADQMGFGLGVSGYASAQAMARRGGREGELVASAGGDMRLGQSTAGALTSFMMSDTAKMMSLGGPEGMMAKLQTPADWANFELDYAENASKMSPAQQAQMLLQTGAKEAEMSGGLMGARGAEYFAFKQLQRLGHGPMEALAILHNAQGMANGDVGNAEADEQYRAPLPSNALDDKSRETGPGGTFRRMVKGFQGNILDIADNFEKNYLDPASQRMAHAFEQRQGARGQAPATLSGLLSDTAGTIGDLFSMGADTAKREAPGFASALGTMATGGVKMAGNILQQISDSWGPVKMGTKMAAGAATEMAVATGETVFEKSKDAISTFGAGVGKFLAAGGAALGAAVHEGIGLASSWADREPSRRVDDAQNVVRQSDISQTQGVAAGAKPVTHQPNLMGAASHRLAGGEDAASRTLDPSHNSKYGFVGEGGVPKEQQSSFIESMLEKAAALGYNDPRALPPEPTQEDRDKAKKAKEDWWGGFRGELKDFLGIKEATPAAVSAQAQPSQAQTQAKRVEARKEAAKAVQPTPPGGVKGDLSPLMEALTHDKSMVGVNDLLGKMDKAREGSKEAVGYLKEHGVDPENLDPNMLKLMGTADTALDKLSKDHTKALTPEMLTQQMLSSGGFMDAKGNFKKGIGAGEQKRLRGMAGQLANEAFGSSGGMDRLKELAGSAREFQTYLGTAQELEGRKGHKEAHRATLDMFMQTLGQPRNQAEASEEQRLRDNPEGVPGFLKEMDKLSDDPRKMASLKGTQLGNLATLAKDARTEKPDEKLLKKLSSSGFFTGEKADDVLKELQKETDPNKRGAIVTSEAVKSNLEKAEGESPEVTNLVDNLTRTLEQLRQTLEAVGARLNHH